MERIFSRDTLQQIGKTVTVEGWVHTRRDHGGLLFVDLRDHTGLVQLVVHPEQSDVFGAAEQLRDEYVVRATGVVVERSAALCNNRIETGAIEIVVSQLTVLNKADALPIQPFACFAYPAVCGGGTGRRRTASAVQVPRSSSTEDADNALQAR